MTAEPAGDEEAKKETKEKIEIRKMIILEASQDDGEERSRQEEKISSPTLWNFSYFSSSEYDDENIKRLKPQDDRRTKSLLRQLSKKYRMEEILGSGTDAQVHRATRRKDGKQFAIKIVDLKRPQRGQRFKRIAQEKDEENIFLARMERMQRELEIHSKLPNHSHIVQCHEIFSDAQKGYLVLDLCTGGTLLDQVCNTDNRVLSTCGAKSVAKQVLEAIHFLHAHGIVHRDLKLENLLLLKPLNSIHDIHIMLADFGSARYLRRRDNMIERKPTAHVGTLAYMAPEQHIGGTVDAALDLWSFGIILAALCTGRHPLRDVPRESWHEEMQRDRLPDGASPQATKDWAKIPQALSLAQGCLRLHPNDRLTAKRALEHPWITNNLCTQTDSLYSDPQQINIPMVLQNNHSRSTIIDDDQDVHALDITRDSDFIQQQSDQKQVVVDTFHKSDRNRTRTRTKKKKPRRHSFLSQTSFLCCASTADDTVHQPKEITNTQSPSPCVDVSSSIIADKEELSQFSPQNEVQPKEAFADSESLPRFESPSMHDDNYYTEETNISRHLSLPQVLEALRQVKRNKLQKILLLVVALRAKDIELRPALDLYQKLAKEKQYLTRHDVQLALLGEKRELHDDNPSDANSQITLRAADELCTAFEDLSIDGSGQVANTEFVAGFLFLQRRSRYDLAQPILRDLDPAGTGTVDAKAIAHFLCAVRDQPIYECGSTVALARVSLPPDEELNELVSSTLGPDASLSYDQVVDLIFQTY